MADYRDISQVYAQKGIGAALILNGGAAITLLSQAVSLIQLGIADEVASSLYAWVFGAFLSALTWVIAFASTRYDDKAEQEKSEGHLKTADKFMTAGIVAVSLSLLAFLSGCALLARAISSITI